MQPEHRTPKVKGVVRVGLVSASFEIGYGFLQCISKGKVYLYLTSKDVMKEIG